MNTGIKVEFCIMKLLKEKSLYFLLPPLFSQETNFLFPDSLLPATGPSHPALEGIPKSVSWPFLIVQDVFSFMRGGGAWAGGEPLCPCVESVSVGFRLAWTGALGSRWAEQ